MSKPELQAPPEIFYGEDEAEKYTKHKRIRYIQRKIAQRAVELLNLPQGQPALLLDIGCGSGLSGEVLSKLPHVSWMGLDIAPAMLAIARQLQTEGDLLRSDIGEGIPFRPNTFDGAISISAIQWLFNADFAGSNPIHRLNLFFRTLHHCLVNGGRAVLQFYTNNEKQLKMLNDAALRAGFGGGLLVDYPQTVRKKKMYLVLFAGMAHRPTNMPNALIDAINDEDSDIGSEEEEDEGDMDKDDEEEDDDEDDSDDSLDEKDDLSMIGQKKKRTREDVKKEIEFEHRRESAGSNSHKGKKQKSYKGKVKDQKERQRRKGKNVRKDTKYTGRKRLGGW
ncbi:MAG: putative S-adenosyl-L-methionine-dependent methyltransferase [Streblomastix strix]|uniref:Putative S-adenosyl-L-methionine-dependent methyltransferase n=1 Tax=Streblomastix strix TaxID=222440 RepID=A0A5J4UP36_9EUKA|nr:MAG: putative S-adenosyl-L-methionine-dependent methyltransferase [Streblomastix strix]